MRALCAPCGAGAAPPRARRRRMHSHPAQQRCVRPRAVGDGGGGGPSVEAQVRLVQSAKRYAQLEEEAEEELDQEELVARAAFEKASAEELTDVQRSYAAQVAEVLSEKAASMAAGARNQGSEAFLLGQKLYERGRYQDAASVLQDALRDAGEQTTLGGEVALWLALAYDASGQREECLTLYKRLEESHSSRLVRKRASELRYILEAPLLEISPDERVSIPQLDQDAGAYSDKRGRAAPPRRKVPLSWEEEWLANYKGPQGGMPNRFVLAATSVLCFCLAVYGFLHVRH